MNTNFLIRFPQATTQYLPRTTSDHSPMVIKLDVCQSIMGTVPFRFRQMWTKHPEFLKLVEVNCTFRVMVLVYGSLRVNLRYLEWCLGSCNKMVFGHTLNHIQDLETQIASLEESLQTEFNKEVEQDLLVSKLELNIWLDRENLRLSHLAKVNWLKDSDYNSKFFHVVINKKRG